MKSFVCWVISVGLMLSIYENASVFAVGNVEKQMLVVFDEETSEKEIEKTVEAVDGDVTETFEQVAVASVELPKDSIDKLRKDLL
ncbi:hypothetical protein BTO30_15795 [Domibacillus antri]|uniref:Fervidolysin-like N-terminal prodomain domain-containing protein n=1 Tax=Domibacillus antri TaxID=1714264 RepID=A0A1Q8Q1U1_9BACI|nr:hypothetical protein [Domibacillus antri]OLN21287.1 hypothetical protein BTO30_15795 [Domibacillus antri]